MLHILLPLSRRAHISVMFGKDHPRQSVLLHKPLYVPRAMFPDASGKIIRYADVKRAIGSRYRRAINNPGLVSPGVKNGPDCVYAVENYPVRSSADRLGRDQTPALDVLGLQERSRLFLPIGHQIDPAMQAVRKQAPQPRHIGFANGAQHELVTEKRRVADDHIGFRPLSFAAAARARCAPRSSR
jgi:hypothetical protein